MQVRVAVVIRAMALGLVLGLMGSAVARAQSTATPGTDDASPAPELDVLAGIAPQDLLDQLLSTEFTETVLPENAGGAEIARWEEGDTDLDGSLGGVVVNLNGMEGGGIGYVVFPDERSAVRRLAETNDQAVAESRGAVVDGFVAVEVDGAAYPARLLVFADYAVCLVRVGPVLVFGGADEGIEPAARREIAVALARAGVAHLLRLATDLGPATPTGWTERSVAARLQAASTEPLFGADGPPRWKLGRAVGAHRGAPLRIRVATHGKRGPKCDAQRGAGLRPRPRHDHLRRADRALRGAPR